MSKSETTDDPAGLAKEIREMHARMLEYSIANKQPTSIMFRIALKDRIDRLCAALECKMPNPDTTRRWRHKKRGTIYRELCRGELQAATCKPEEGEWMVVYQGDDGRIWIRASGEFNDGRFEEVPHDPT